MRVAHMVACLSWLLPLPASAQPIALCIDAGDLADTVRIELSARGYEVLEACDESAARVGVEVPDPLGAFYVWLERPDGARRTARLEGPFDRADARVLAIAIVGVLEEPSIERSAPVSTAPEPVVVPAPPSRATADPTPSEPSTERSVAPLEVVESSRIVNADFGVELALTGTFGDERGGLGGMFGLHGPLSPWLRLRGEVVGDVAPGAFAELGAALGVEAVISLERARDWLAFGVEGRMQLRLPIDPVYDVRLAFGPGATAEYRHAIADEWTVLVRLGGAPVFSLRPETPPGYRLFGAVGLGFR